MEELLKTEIIIRDKLFDLFLAKANSFWNKWAKKTAQPKERIGDFFLQYGPVLIKEYLTTNFPFAANRIFINVQKGGTEFDIIFFFIYRFNKSELEAMKEIAEKDTETLSSPLIATRIFAEALLSFNTIISETVGYKYVMMLNEVKFLRKKGYENEIVYMELHARPHD